MNFLKENAAIGDGGSSIWCSPGAALQLSPENRYAPNRLVFTGHINGRQNFWLSDDGDTWFLAKNFSGGALDVTGIGETALAETPDGGIFTSSRNGIFHGPGKCNCRATLCSPDGATSFNETLDFDPILVEPIASATMVNGGHGTAGAIFHANPGHGTDKEEKSPPNGRASGTIRRSTDGGKTWEANVVLNGDRAFSYSCLSKVPAKDYVGLAWETVLPGSGVPATWSANNVVFTLIPQDLKVSTSKELRSQLI